MLKRELPAYLYNLEEFPHKNDGALFHYTSLNSFLKVMEDLSLKPSSFDKLNDLNEMNIQNMCMESNFSVMYKAEEYIKKKCHTISFSQNYKNRGYEFEGTNHPAMWAHYADDSKGVCIVIDKDTFITKNKDILSQHFYKFADVKYNKFNTPDVRKIKYRAKTPEGFIKDNWKSLFFLKHDDWAKENEHRLFIMDYDGKFCIDGCIMYITFGVKLYNENTKIKEILDIIVNPRSNCYQKFIPHSFASVNYCPEGYETFGIANKISDIIQVNNSNPLYANYKKWLNEKKYAIW